MTKILIEEATVKLALEALVAMSPSGPTGSLIWHQQMYAITALREAQAEQPAQQEPVAWMCHPFGDEEVEYGPHQECENCIPLYTSPPAQRTWVGLTKEDRDGVWTADQMMHEEWEELFNTIEAKLKEKNT